MKKIPKIDQTLIPSAPKTLLRDIGIRKESPVVSHSKDLPHSPRGNKEEEEHEVVFYSMLCGTAVPKCAAEHGNHKDRKVRSDEWSQTKKKIGPLLPNLRRIDHSPHTPRCKSNPKEGKSCFQP